MSWKYFTVFSLIALTAFSLNLFGSPQQAAKSPQRDLQPFMQQKLEHAKAILEGLTRENYDQIAENARALSLLSLESQWNVITTEEYLDQSADFRRAARAISEAAGEKDLHRAALGYVNLTVRCVECHTYLRNRAEK